VRQEVEPIRLRSGCQASLQVRFETVLEKDEQTLVLADEDAGRMAVCLVEPFRSIRGQAAKHQVGVQGAGALDCSTGTPRATSRFSARARSSADTLPRLA
jgi:hypothetical protein